MSGARKLDEPVFVESAFTPPTPMPVLTNEHRAGDGAVGVQSGDLGSPVTASDVSYPDIGARYISSAFGSYYNRVYAVPRVLSLTDPKDGEENPFYLWNANYNVVALDEITATNDGGMVLSFDAGLSLSGLELKSVSVVITPAAPTSAEATYLFEFDNGGMTPFTLLLFRTNLFLVVPETPVEQKRSWKTNIITAQDGTEQRVTLRPIPRDTLTYKMVFSSEDEERTIYNQLLLKGGSLFSAPVWHSPVRIMEDAIETATIIKIDTTKYDVQPEDQFIFTHEDETYEIMRVRAVQSDGVTISLYAPLLAPLAAGTRVYRVEPVMLPAKPSLRRGHYDALETTLELELTNARELFTGTAEFKEIERTTYLKDRVLSPVVSTLAGIPVLHPRPLVPDQINDGFDWNVERIDYDTGAFEQITYRNEASASYERNFLLRGFNQSFYFNALLDYMDGMRRVVWMPTWQYELTERVIQTSENTITIGDERFADDYPATGSHRGLWIKTPNGWLARQITAIEKDGSGNSVVSISPGLPVGFSHLPPVEFGFLVMTRLGADEVTFQHKVNASYLTFPLVSTFSTGWGNIYGGDEGEPPTPPPEVYRWWTPLKGSGGRKAWFDDPNSACYKQFQEFATPPAIYDGYEMVEGKTTVAQCMWHRDAVYQGTAPALVLLSLFVPGDSDEV